MNDRRSALRLRPWTIPAIALAVAALALTLALFMVDRVGEQIIDAQAQSEAADERDYMVALAREEGLAALIATLDRRERTHGGAGFRYALTDAKGRPLAGAPALSHAPLTKGWKVVELPEAGRQKRWHVLVGSLPTGESLVVAQDSRQRAAFRSAIFDASAFALIFAAIACTAAGFGLSALMLRRAGAIANIAERIAAGEFHARIEVSEPGDAFDRLGASLNAMLTRIDELMTGLRTVTDSLAHDLRTPLTRLKGALSRAMDNKTSEAMRLEALEQAHDEADRALATFSALLDIARAETGLSQEMMREVDLVALIGDVADLFAPAFEEAGQTLTVAVPQEPVLCRAHDLLLRQAVGNLLHNAAKYAGPGAAVRVGLEREGAKLRIVVADTGPGIPGHEYGRVQERFVRLDAARAMAGAGLGLSIVAACAKLHHGKLTLSDNKPGLKAALEIVCRS